ncbi:PspA/IM30 family protein [Qipengyuania psychrotolerans]|uniref:PspA/IM30 family protein n=1 Tax=Qipengyuania psychrotolerans TaxID=2867238 RepID=A0ABX8ZIK5_9SPHN|nr:PspA/IM30 family protein [Qipengyuania psychrotolerans]QZD87494.1 PspA/IM30 family protein [Qipengyuania psychrotolerans]
MVRIAIQVKELISSNLTSALDGATNPVKMLAQLQREIEEALISLTGDISKARRQKDRLDAEQVRAQSRIAEWNEKAKIAMDHQREDLARQALLAREDCRAGIEEIKQDIATLDEELTAMHEAEIQLEAKRDSVRARMADLRAADGNASGIAARSGDSDRVSKRMQHIEELEKRTDFAADDQDFRSRNASVDREIEEMSRDRAVDEELAAMRETGTAKRTA